MADAAVHVVVDRFAGADGHQVLEGEVALPHACYIGSVQHGAALEAAGAAAAAVFGRVGDGGGGTHVRPLDNNAANR
jgi:hypothetical protein